MSLLESLAYRWGQIIAGYAQRVVLPQNNRTEGEEQIPAVPTIWLGWHSTNLIASALHKHYTQRRLIGFMPPGLTGEIMRGRMDREGFISQRLPNDGTGNPQAALKQMARGLAGNNDVIIAADGPHGPAWKVRPGALWLARLTGRPLMLVGFAARPAIRIPRWDRHLVPLPGARFATVFGTPIHIPRNTPLEPPLLASMDEALNILTRRAQELLDN